MRGSIDALGVAEFGIEEGAMKGDEGRETCFSLARNQFGHPGVMFWAHCLLSMFLANGDKVWLLLRQLRERCVCSFWFSPYQFFSFLASIFRL